MKHKKRLSTFVLLLSPGNGAKAKYLHPMNKNEISG
jgi:hypothetical protein